MVFCSLFLKSVRLKCAHIWHFNTNLLVDGHFRDVSKFFGVSFTKSGYKQWWDYAKVKIKQLCQEYTANVTKDVIHSVRTQNVGEQTGNQAFAENFKTKKKTLADFLGLRAQSPSFTWSQGPTFKVCS